MGDQGARRMSQREIGIFGERGALRDHSTGRKKLGVEVESIEWVASCLI
jgi:hypothetical protein